MGSLRKYLVLAGCWLVLHASAWGQESLAEALQMVKDQYRLNNFDSALRLSLEGLLQAENQDKVAYSKDFNFQLGKIYLAQSNFPKAVDHFISIIYPAEMRNHDIPDLAAAYYELGKVYLKMGAFNEARRCFTSSRAYYRKSQDKLGQVKAIKATGLSHFEAKQYYEAVATYRDLIDSIDHFTMNRSIIKNCYESLLSAILFTTNVDLGIEYGNEYETRVESEWEQSADIYDYMCTLLRRKGAIEASAGFGQKAVDLEPHNVSYLQNLAESFVVQGQFEQALAMLDLAEENTHTHDNGGSVVQILIARASAHVEQGDHKTAIANLEEMENGDHKAQPSEWKMIYSMLQTAHEARNNPTEARKYQFLLRDVEQQIDNANRIARHNIEKADNLAANFEQQYRLGMAEKQRQSLAMEQALLRSEQEQQKILLLQQKQTIQQQELERQKLEAVRIEQNLQITEQLLEAQKKESALAGLQREAELQALRELENQQELELARRERLILQQQSDLQRAEIQAANRQGQLFLVIIGFTLLVLAVLAFLLIRISRSRKIITDQKKDLERQQHAIKQAQIELTETLDKEQEARKGLQKTNKELKEAQSQLIHAEKMSSLGQLTAGIVHEINNPVNFVKGGIETLDRTLKKILLMMEQVSELRSNGSEEELQDVQKQLNGELEFTNEVVPQIIKDVLFGTRRIEEIVNSLRIFSRQDDETPKKVNLHAVIDSALLIMRTKYLSVAEINRDYTEEVREIECFPGQLNQVIVNLVSNAVDAIGKHGQIDIVTRDEGDMISLTIRDDGKGMDPKVLEHVFEPFFTTKEVGKGTGLGLSISYSIIERHGGSITAKSRKGEGTEFKVMLRKEIESAQLPEPEWMSASVDA